MRCKSAGTFLSSPHCHPESAQPEAGAAHGSHLLSALMRRKGEQNIHQNCAYGKTFLRAFSEIAGQLW
jgi:hypothetical protein